MMRSDEDRLRRVQEALREEARGTPPAPLRNIGLALNLNGDDVLHWRGRSYTVPPIPWDEGVRLLEIQTELHRLTQDDGASLTEYRLLLRRAVRLFPRLIRRPFSWLRPNPFRKASGQELGTILGFFSACQMKPPAGAQSEMGASPRQSTSRMERLNFHEPSLRGR
jgi:hypothetical protein